MSYRTAVVTNLLIVLIGCGMTGFGLVFIGIMLAVSSGRSKGNIKIDQK